MNYDNLGVPTSVPEAGLETIQASGIGRPLGDRKTLVARNVVLEAALARQELVSQVVDNVQGTLLLERLRPGTQEDRFATLLRYQALAELVSRVTEAHTSENVLQLEERPRRLVEDWGQAVSEMVEQELNYRVWTGGLRSIELWADSLATKAHIALRTASLHSAEGIPAKFGEAYVAGVLRERGASHLHTAVVSYEGHRQVPERPYDDRAVVLGAVLTATADRILFSSHSKPSSQLSRDERTTSFFQDVFLGEVARYSVPLTCGLGGIDSWDGSQAAEFYRGLYEKLAAATLDDETVSPLRVGSPSPFFYGSIRRLGSIEQSGIGVRLEPARQRIARSLICDLVATRDDLLEGLVEFSVGTIVPERDRSTTLQQRNDLLMRYHVVTELVARVTKTESRYGNSSVLDGQLGLLAGEWRRVVAKTVDDKLNWGIWKDGLKSFGRWEEVLADEVRLAALACEPQSADNVPSSFRDAILVRQLRELASGRLHTGVVEHECCRQRASHYRHDNVIWQGALLSAAADRIAFPDIFVDEVPPEVLPPVKRFLHDVLPRELGCYRIPVKLVGNSGYNVDGASYREFIDDIYRELVNALRTKKG